MVLVKLTRTTVQKVLLCSLFLGIFLVLEEQQRTDYQNGTITLTTLWKLCAVSIDLATWSLEPLLKYRTMYQGNWLLKTGQHHSDKPMQMSKINLEIVMSIIGLIPLLEISFGLIGKEMIQTLGQTITLLIIVIGTMTLYRSNRILVLSACIPMCVGFQWLTQFWQTTIETPKIEANFWEQGMDFVYEGLYQFTIYANNWYGWLSTVMMAEPVVKTSVLETIYNWLEHLMYQYWIGQFIVYVWFLMEVDWHKRYSRFQIIGTIISYGFVDYVYGITWMDTGLMLLTIVFLRTNYVRWHVIIPALCACFVYDPLKLTTMPCLVLINYLTMKGTKMDWTRFYCRIETTHIGFFYLFSMIYGLMQQRDIERLWASFCLTLFGFNFYWQPCTFSYVSAIYHNFDLFKITTLLTLTGNEYSEMIVMQQNPIKINMRAEDEFSEWIVVNLTEKPTSNVNVTKFNHYYTNSGLSLNVNLFQNTNQFKYGDRAHRLNRFAVGDVIFQTKPRFNGMLYCFLQLSCNWLFHWMNVPNHVSAITCSLITAGFWFFPIRIQQRINEILNKIEKKSEEMMKESQAIDKIWEDICQRSNITQNNSDVQFSQRTVYDNNAWQDQDHHAQLRRNVLVTERHEQLGTQQPKQAIQRGIQRSAVLCDLSTRRSLPSCRDGPPSYHAASLHSAVVRLETPLQQLKQRLANFVQQEQQQSDVGSWRCQNVASNDQHVTSGLTTTLMTHDQWPQNEEEDGVQLPTEIESKQALFERMTPLYHTNNVAWQTMRQNIQRGFFNGLIFIGRNTSYVRNIVIRLLLVPVLVANVFMLPTFVCLVMYFCIQGGDASALSNWVSGVREGTINMNILPDEIVTSDPYYGVVVQLLSTTKWCDTQCYFRWILVNWINIVGLSLLISAVWAWLMFFRRLLSDLSLQFFLVTLMALVLVLNAQALLLVTIAVVMWNAFQYYIGRHSFIDVITIGALHAPFALMFNLLSYGFTIWGYKPPFLSHVTITDIIASSFIAGFCMGIIWLMEFRKSDLGRGQVVIIRDENGRLIERHVRFGRLSSFLFGNIAGDLMVPTTVLSGDFSGLWNQNKLIVERFTAPGDDNPSGEFLYSMIVNAHKQGTLTELLEIINEEKQIPMHFQTPMKALFNSDAMGIICAKRGGPTFPGEGVQQLANGWLCDIDGTTYCVTNAHAVTDPTRLDDIFVKMDNDKMKPINDLYFWNRQGFFQLNLVTWDAKADVAILALKDCKITGFRVGKLTIGKPYIWCGCAPPLNDPKKVFFYNVLCSTRGQVYHPNGEYGDSGSILVDNNGRVVAMKYGIQVGTTALSEIGFFVPVSSLGALKREISKSEHELIRDKRVAASTILSKEILMNKDHREFLTNYLANTDEIREVIRDLLDKNDLDGLNKLVSDLSTDAKHLKSLQKMLTGELIVKKGRKVIAETQFGEDEAVLAIKTKIEQVTKDIEQLQQMVTMYNDDDPIDKALLADIKLLQDQLTQKKKELAQRQPQTKNKETCQKLGMLGQYKSQLKQELQTLLGEKVPNQEEIKQVKDQLKICNETITKVQEMLKEGKDNIDQLIENSINPTRMPDSLRQIRYPLWFQDPDTKKYLTVLSDELKIETTGHPAFAKEIMDYHETYGYTAGQWRRRIQRAGVSYQWYQQMIAQLKKMESCGLTQNIKYWVKRMFLGENFCLRQITCPDCGKKLVCDKEEHTGCSEYLVKQLERHLQCCLGHCGVGKEFMVLNTIFLFDGQHIMLSNKQHCLASVTNSEHRCFRIGCDDDDKFKSKKHHYYQVTMDDGKKIYVFKQCIDDLKKTLDAHVKPALELDKNFVKVNDHENDMQHIVTMFEELANKNEKMFGFFQTKFLDLEKQSKILKDELQQEKPSLNCACNSSHTHINQELTQITSLCIENSKIIRQFEEQSNKKLANQQNDFKDVLKNVKEKNASDIQNLQQEVRSCVSEMKSLSTGMKALKEDIDNTVGTFEISLNQAVTKNDIKQIWTEWWQQQQPKLQRPRVGFASCPTSRSNSMEDLTLRSILKPDVPPFQPKIEQPIFDWSAPIAISDWALEVEKEEQILSVPSEKEVEQPKQKAEENKTEKIAPLVCDSATSEDEKKREKRKRTKKKKVKIEPSSSGEEAVEKVQLFLSNRPGFHDNAVGDCHCPRCQCEPDCECALCSGRFCIWCNTDQHSTINCIHAKEKKCTKCNKYLNNWWNDTFYKYGEEPCKKLCCMEAKDKPCGVCWNKGHLPLSCPILKHVAITTNPLNREINTAGVNKQVIKSLILPMGTVKAGTTERGTLIGKNHNRKKSPIKRDFQ